MASDGKQYGPSVTLCRLYERVSKSGNCYLTGRLGGAKIAILKSNETTDDGVPIWNVVLQEAPPKAAAKADGERETRRTVRTEPDTPDDVNQDHENETPGERLNPPARPSAGRLSRQDYALRGDVGSGSPPNEWDDPIPF